MYIINIIDFNRLFTAVCVPENETCSSSLPQPIKKRGKELRSDLSMSIDILSKNKSELLDEGKSLLNLMKKTMYDSSN